VSDSTDNFFYLVENADADDSGGHYAPKTPPVMGLGFAIQTIVNASRFQAESLNQRVDAKAI
jgi:hypothetical protein